MSYTLTNLDPFNAIEVGALSIPLVFQVIRQVALLCQTSMQQPCHEKQKRACLPFTMCIASETSLDWSSVEQGRWDGLTLEQMSQLSTFTDMHLGGHHGWVTVTPMSGRGPTLVLLPENGTRFEVWRSGREDAANAGPLWTPHIMLHSKSYRVWIPFAFKLCFMCVQHPFGKINSCLDAGL